MGLKDLLKKALTGASDEDNRKNKAKMREIFNSLVADGDAYTLIYCHMENSHNAVVVEVNVHSNYQLEPITYDPGIKASAKYSVAVTQSTAEVAEFRKFFKAGL